MDEDTPVADAAKYYIEAKMPLTEPQAETKKGGVDTLDECRQKIDRLPGNKRSIASVGVDETVLDKVEETERYARYRSHKPVIFITKTLTPTQEKPILSTETYTFVQADEGGFEQPFAYASGERVDGPQVPVVTVEIIHPTGDPTSAFAPATSEFTYSATTPGVLTIRCEARIIPAAAQAELQNNLKWEITPIDDSHTPPNRLTYVNMEWSNTWTPPQDPLTPWVSGKGLKPTVTFTGLPRHNDHFGRKTVTVSLHLDDQPILTQTTDLEVFFSRDATNNRTSNAENWFYYWNQTPAGDEDARWDNRQIVRTYKAMVPAILEWATCTDPKDRIFVSDAVRTTLGFSHVRRDSSNQTVTGIDVYATIIRHENHHVTQISQHDNLVPFLVLPSGQPRNGWSWNVSPNNHYDRGADGQPGVAGVDDDNNGTVDDVSELGVGDDNDLDADNDNIADQFDTGIAAPPGEVEGQAGQQETIPQDTHRTQDWGDPGKQHAPDGGSTSGEINKFDD